MCLSGTRSGKPEFNLHSFVSRTALISQSQVRDIRHNRNSLCETTRCTQKWSGTVAPLMPVRMYEMWIKLRQNEWVGIRIYEYRSISIMFASNILRQRKVVCVRVLHFNHSRAHADDVCLRFVMGMVCGSMFVHVYAILRRHCSSRLLAIIRAKCNAIKASNVFSSKGEFIILDFAVSLYRS